MKVFLVSATLTKQFQGTKHRITKKELKENSKRKEGQGKENFVPKLQALMKRIRFTGKPKVIDLTSLTLFPKDLKEYKTTCAEETDKPIYLYQFITSHPEENFIIFTNSISYAKKVLNILNILEIRSVLLHSEMQQRQRLKKLDSFRNGICKVLVCTDVAARGLDIPQVKNVIHYQVPKDIDTYVHRSGRTARIGRPGVAYVLIGPEDQQRYQKLCGQLKKSQGIENASTDFKEKLRIQSLVKNAMRFEQKKHQLDKQKHQNSWYTKHAEAADIDIDDEIQREMKQVEEQVAHKKILVQKESRNFKAVQKKMFEVNRSRRNALYLDPAHLRELADRMRGMKESKQPQRPFEVNRKRKNNDR